MSNDDQQPPSFQPIHTVDLFSIKDSKIVSVSVYSGRAEITRVFAFDVKTGQNQVNISGLPNILDFESLRVEGRGSATIHDVTVSATPKAPKPTTSPELKALLKKKERTQKALQRCKKSLDSLETYLGSLNAQHVDVSDLGKIVENYDKTGESLDDKVAELEAQLAEIDEEIKEENSKFSGPVENEKLRLKASIGVFANSEGEVEIALVYAVNGASWHAFYDIRVDMHTKENPITLIYKAAITQNTGEDWEDVPLTLETASPTFGLGIPALQPWTLSIYQQPVAKANGLVNFAKKRSMGRATLQDAAMLGGDYSASQEEYSAAPVPALMRHRRMSVMSKGNITATFGIPGLITIPSDSVAHNVTIVKLTLEAEMSWVSVPKRDAKMHLNAKIKNASEFTLFSGTASVYVDGSFISRSSVPSVSPEESFDCPLGLDPSIRITYHPRVKKVSQSGFYTKNSHHVFSQRVTIFNTKSTPVNKVKVIDQVPVSEDSLITVKLVSPSLVLPSGDNTSNGALKLPPPVKVGNGVFAQWDGADETGSDVEALGKNGKFSWVCSVPAQEKINLTLQWEVTAPIRTDIAGLN